MNAVRIRRRLDSETLHLPELRSMIGRTVEIIVLEEPSLTAEEEARWKPLTDIAGQDLVDPEAYKELRAASMI